jgi:exodeoxyribonuclease V beta subunit
VSLNDLQQMDSEEIISAFVNYRLDSHRLGLHIVLDTVFQEKGVYAKFLQRIDGERQYTDAMQLLELIQNQVDIGNNENQIALWLAKEIEQANVQNQDESTLRKLESDGEKISIMTLHKSKGLEFDCVFIPYAEKIKAINPPIDGNIKACIATHNENKQGVIYWQHSDTVKSTHSLEQDAETLRLIYVAITRAKHRVYLGLDSSKKTILKTAIYRYYAQIIENDVLCSVVDGNYRCDKSDNEQVNYPEILQPTTFNRTLLTPLSVYSFSSLSRKQEIPYQESEQTPLELDYENYFHFPKGSTSGTMQHEILEHIDFDAEIDAIKAEVKKQLAVYSFNENWIDCLSQQMVKITQTNLWQNGPKLAEIVNSIDEMEFLLPVGKHKRSIDKHSISKWLSTHRKQATVFNQDNLQGYLTGFIDLVFEFNNKYYVVDYKSNHLGASFADYSQQNLKQAIEHHYYDLQYLLYCVALVKYLQITFDDFDYEKDFGGVAYIFTRGINGDTGQGVYFTKPENDLIQEMLGAFDARK